MIRRHSLGFGCVLATMLLLAAPGCDDSVEVGPKKSKQSSVDKPAPKARDAGAPDAGEERLRLDEDTFVPNGTKNRNPFRSFKESFQAEAPEQVQRRVLMPDTSIDQMRLVAIISGVPQPKAMLTDPAGVGHVVERGDYIGRAEVIQAGGAEGMPVTLNWRVDRIRAQEIVLTRKNPTAPDKPPLTRVIPLHQKKPGER